MLMSTIFIESSTCIAKQKAVIDTSASTNLNEIFVAAQSIIDKLHDEMITWHDKLGKI